MCDGNDGVHGSAVMTQSCGGPTLTRLGEYRQRLIVILLLRSNCDGYQVVSQWGYKKGICS